MILCYKGCRYERKVSQKVIRSISSQYLRTVKYRGVIYQCYQVPQLSSQLKYKVRYRGNYIRSESLNLSQELAVAIIQIQSILDKMQSNGIPANLAQKEVAKLMIDQAKWNPTKKKELMKWGQSLGDPTVSETIKVTVNYAIMSVI